MPAASAWEVTSQTQVRQKAGAVFAGPVPIFPGKKPKLCLLPAMQETITAASLQNQYSYEDCMDC